MAAVIIRSTVSRRHFATSIVLRCSADIDTLLLGPAHVGTAGGALGYRLMAGRAHGRRTLIGDRAGRYSVRLTANVRITFGWDGEGAVDVDIEDYH